jgi:hypothetical protein
MKFGIITSRSRNGSVFEDREYVDSCLTRAIMGMCPDRGKNAVIISGGGRGPETFAIDYANRHGMDFEKVIPKIKTLGHEKAFMARNRTIIDSCDVLVVFWCGENPYIVVALNDAAFSRKTTIVFPIQ